MHTQSNVHLQAGDTVSYWVYAVLDGRGQQILDQTWTYGEYPSGTVVMMVSPSGTVVMVASPSGTVVMVASIPLGLW